MVATSKHQDAKACYDESCYCGVLDIQSMATGKVNCINDTKVINTCVSYFQNYMYFFLFTSLSVFQQRKIFCLK